MLNIRPGDEDTICAQATAPGVGAIAVVRVSGARALSIVRALAPFLPTAPESHRVYFGTLADGAGSIDEVLVTFFAKGRSFTGEESLEISCHGGTQITGGILEALIRGGARLAKPGEFTYRAFLHGRIDLVQAESVLALIESRSDEASKQALAQLKGELSRRFQEIEDDLLWLGAQLEASIDFSSDGVELTPSKDLLDRAAALEQRVSALVASYQRGRLLTEGLTVALIGAPNAGKSSLLNALAEEDRAIVTAEPGTTRDLIEVETRFDGTAIRWVDTAGIRESTSAAEKIGVERSLAMRQSADLALVVIDSSRADWREHFSDFVRGALARPAGSEWYVFNKIDLDKTGEWRASIEAEGERLGAGSRTVFVSALRGTGLAELKAAVAEVIREKSGDGGPAVLQARHVEGLERIQDALRKALDLIEKDVSPELIAFELQVAVKTVHELLGKVFHEQVIDRIFKEFCLGK